MAFAGTFTREVEPKNKNLESCNPKLSSDFLFFNSELLRCRGKGEGKFGEMYVYFQAVEPEKIVTLVCHRYSCVNED